MKIRPPLFSGEADGENVEGWLLHFKGVCVASGIFDDAQRIALLTVSVEGEAERWARARGQVVASRMPAMGRREAGIYRALYRQRLRRADQCLAESIEARCEQISQMLSQPFPRVDRTFGRSNGGQLVSLVGWGLTCGFARSRKILLN